MSKKDEYIRRLRNLGVHVYIGPDPTEVIVEYPTIREAMANREMIRDLRPEESDIFARIYPSSVIKYMHGLKEVI